MYIKVYEQHMKEKFLDLWGLDLKALQNTLLVTFLNVVFRSDKHLFSRLHYNVKRKRLP